MFARLRQVPLIVLSADRAWGPQIPSMIAAGTLPADVPQNFGYVTDAAQKEAQETARQARAAGEHTPTRTAATISTRRNLNS